jgi:hypothetical protein
MPNSIFRRTAAKPPIPATSPVASRAPQSATSDVIHHTYETLNSRRFLADRTLQHDRRRAARDEASNAGLTLLPPAQVRTRSQHPRGSSLPRKAKKIPSASYNQILLSRPKSVQDDLILNYPDPYCVTSLERSDDLDSSLKTTDSGQTSGCSSGSSTVGSQSPKSHADSDALKADCDAIGVHCDAVSPPRRQSAFTALPNRGPPPRHLVPATLRPSPAVKLHPADVLLSLQSQEKGRIRRILSKLDHAFERRQATEWRSDFSHGHWSHKKLIPSAFVILSLL